MSRKATPFRPASRLQRGYTLIEILVALLISLFFLVGLFTLEQTTSRTNRNQTALVQLQDEQRLAMMLLNDVISSAGYYPNPATNTATNAFPAWSGSAGGETISLAAGQAIGGTHTSTSSPDTIAVQYETNNDDTIINCLGGTNTSGSTQVYVNTFSVSGGQLMCSLNGATSVPIVSNVENLQVFYGVRTNGGTVAGNVDTYLTADEVTSGNYWGLNGSNGTSNIISVRVSVTFDNPLYGQPGQPQYITFTRFVNVAGQTGVST